MLCNCKSGQVLGALLNVKDENKHLYLSAFLSCLFYTSHAVHLNSSTCAIILTSTLNTCKVRASGPCYKSLQKILISRINTHLPAPCLLRTIALHCRRSVPSGKNFNCLCIMYLKLNGVQISDLALFLFL